VVSFVVDKLKENNMSKEFKWNFSQYDDLDKAVKDASRRAQRDADDQVIYQAIKIVKPDLSALPQINLVDYTPGAVVSSSLND
jgi:hypothetical protein